MLTTAQQAILKAAILADPELDAFPQNGDGAWDIAIALNLPADPAFVVWRSDVPTKDCKKAMNWVEYIGRSVGERDAWQFMLSNGTINPSDINVRQGIADIFSGPQAAATRAALLAIATRTATRAEKLFATGDGTVASPGTMGYEGNLSYQDVLEARNS